MRRGIGPRGRGCRQFENGMERNGFLNPTIAYSNGSPTKEFEKEMKFRLDEFIKSGTMSLSFPVMSSAQRKSVHVMAKKLRLQTKSVGEEPNRYIVVSIRHVQISRASGASTDPIILNEQCYKKASELSNRYPITEEDVEHFLKERSNNHLHHARTSSGLVAKVPPPIRNQNSEIYNTRRGLPSFKYRQLLIDSIRNNSVVIVSGGTGCGKTTQVPQFLLEEASDRNEKVRIMCTQPRRIAAISIAERVARERGERLGDTVGYHIRLEQKTSEKTILTYCTSGVLLRMLSTDSVANGITHIILDEIHERETNTDYLLIALKQALGKRRDLKIILMSATIEGNMNLFESYFNEKFVDVIRIESKLFDVHKVFLGDILAMIGYDPPETMFGCMFSASGDGNQFPSMGVWEDPKPQGQIAQSSNQNKMMFNGVDQGQYFNQNQTLRHSNTEPVLDDFWVPKSQQPPSQAQSHQQLQPHAQSYSNFQNIPPPNYHQPQHGQMQQIQSNGMNCQPDYRSQPPPNQPYSYQASSNDCVTNSKGEWVGGSYVMTDGEEISESGMLAFEAAVGGLHVRPVVHIPPVPNRSPPQQAQFGQYQEMCGSQQSLQQGYPVQVNGSQQMMQQQQQPQTPSSYELGERPTFFVPSKTSSVLTTAGSGSASSTGLAKYNTESDVFGASMNRGKELEKRYRADFKNAFPNRPPFFEKSVLPRVRQANIAQWNLEAKYMACGGNQFEESVDCNLVSEVIRYLADSPIFGSILVFLPGFDDIVQVKQKIEEWKYGLSNYNQVNVLCLHSQMNSVDQSEIFNKVPKNVRKVILSTNIAEASVTIEDVIFVVDSGKVKEKVFRHETKFSQLKVTNIAKSNSEQRAGRAGRVTDGYCFRLYSVKDYNAMPETQLAEMQRTAIYDVCLHAKLFAPKGMRVSEFLQMAPEPPSVYSIEHSMEFLEQLGALYSESKNSNELPEGDYDETQDPELTDLGRIMAQMPLDPQLARLLIFGLALKCLNPVLNLVALLSYRDPYIIAAPSDRENQNRARERVARRDFSDHLMYIRLVDDFSKYQNAAAQRFCSDNYLNYNTMRMIVGVRRQLLFELMRAKLIDSDKDVSFAMSNLEYNKYSNCWPMVQAAIAAGCYPCVGVSTGNSNKLRKVQTHADSKSTLHPASVVKRQANMKADSHEKEPQLQFVVYQELSMIEGGLALRGATVVPAATVLLLTGPLRLKHSVICDYDLVQDAEENEELKNEMARYDNGYETYEIESWYAVRALRKDLKCLLRLRFKLMHHFLKALHTPALFGAPDNHFSETLEALRVILTEENLRCRFGKAEMPDIPNLKRYPPPMTVMPSPAPVQNQNQHQNPYYQHQAMRPSTSSPYLNQMSQHQGYFKNQNQSQALHIQAQSQNYYHQNYQMTPQQSPQGYQNHQNHQNYHQNQNHQQQNQNSGQIAYHYRQQQNFQKHQNQVLGHVTHQNSYRQQNSQNCQSGSGGGFYEQPSSSSSTYFQKQKPYNQQRRQNSEDQMEDYYREEKKYYEEDRYEKNQKNLYPKNGSGKRKNLAESRNFLSRSNQNQKHNYDDDYDDYEEDREQYAPTKKYDSNRGQPKGRGSNGNGLAGFGKRNSGKDLNKEVPSRNRVREDSDDGWTPKYTSNPKPRGGGSSNRSTWREVPDRKEIKRADPPPKPSSANTKSGAFGRMNSSSNNSQPSTSTATAKPKNGNRNGDNNGRVEQERPVKSQDRAPKESASSSSGWTSNTRNRQSSHNKYKKTSNQRRNENGRNDDNH